LAAASAVSAAEVVLSGEGISQRKSGYARRAHDLYETPAWCVDALLEVLTEIPGRIWEPAVGGGSITAALRAHGFDVVGTDITQGVDFLKTGTVPARVQTLVTNPPYRLAQGFIEHALSFDQIRIVAMLLRIDYDSARRRQHLFAGCPAFAGKLVLTKRIRWIEGSTGSPSFNHAWYLWDRQWMGAPMIAYAPTPPRLIIEEFPPLQRPRQWQPCRATTRAA
jgi:hypothetical protein